MGSSGVNILNAPGMCCQIALQKGGFSLYSLPGWHTCFHLFLLVTGSITTTIKKNPKGDFLQVKVCPFLLVDSKILAFFSLSREDLSYD